jgi:hypothetical protein
MPVEWDTKETLAHVVPKEKLVFRVMLALVVVRVLPVYRVPVVLQVGHKVTLAYQAARVLPVHREVRVFSDRKVTVEK